MKAIRFHAYGGPEVPRLEEIPVPEAQPGEVLIRVQAAGVNFFDAYQRMGLYKTPLPFVPGMVQSAARSRVKSLVKEWFQLLITHRKRIRT